MGNDYFFDLNKITNFLSNAVNSFYYYTAARANRYPCKLVGEKLTDDAKTTHIIYRIVGKKGIHEISIPDLLDDEKLLARFHPTEAVKFGAIAVGDVLFNIPEEEKIKKIKMMKRKMLSSTKA